MATVLTKVTALQEFLLLKKRNGSKVGFVPTMGALHEGHLSLVRLARKEADVVVVSIFVNPIQFNNKKDLERYPRNLEQDIQLLEKEHADFIFAPSVEEMYPDNAHQTYDFDGLEKRLEGAFRPGHFQGVAVVVHRLFDIVKPDFACFGEKDYQQLLIIKKLVALENLPVKIIGAPIVREPDGLAMSSRNQLLKNNERMLASMIYQVLKIAKEKAATMSPQQVIAFVQKYFDDIPEFTLEYFTIVDSQNLLPIVSWKNAHEPRGLIAVYLNEVRLIDNIVF